MANAVFSGISGIALLVGGGYLAALFDVDAAWIFRVVGVGLILFAVDLANEARKAEVGRWKALYFSFGDFGWVLGSVILLALTSFPTPAKALVVVAMLVVLAFGVSQVRCIAGTPAPTD